MLTQLGSQFGQLKTRSLVVPPDDPELISMETAQESDGEDGTVLGSKALSEAETLEGPDGVEIDEEDEEDKEMEDEEDECETKDRTPAPHMKPKPKEGDLQKCFQL